MKRLALFALLLVPGPAFAIDQANRARDGETSPVPAVACPEAKTDCRVDEGTPRAAPWSRPPGNDDASASFRYGLGGRLRRAIRPQAHDLDAPPAPWLSRPGLKVIEGELSATPERAEHSAFEKLGQAVSAWVAPEVPRSWKVPAATVRALAGTTREIEEVHKDYGTLYKAVLRCDFSPAHRAEIVRAYESEVVARRLGVLGVVLAFVLACLAALAAYIRADEATKGYYTNRLRLIAAAGVGASGVVAVRVLRGVLSS